MTDQLWYPEAFLQNDWTRKYRVLVESAQAEKRSKIGSEYATHHIVPESFFIQRSRPGPQGWLSGNPEDPSNLVLLTHREHAQAHLWLCQGMTEGLAKQKMATALQKMIGGMKIKNQSHDLCPVALEMAMKNAAEAGRAWSIATASNPEAQRKKGEATRRSRQKPSVQAKYRDSWIRIWEHKDGRSFVGTRWQLEESVGLPGGALKWLTRKKPHLTSRGWRITAETGKWLVLPTPAPSPPKPTPAPRPDTGRTALKPEKRNNTVWLWRHDATDREFVGTRYDLEVQEHMPRGTLYPLMRSKSPKPRIRGWRRARQIMEDEDK